ncbi:hypothetical protein [Pseudonocardia lacus]|uniref:hypothetical protein n=1 Tax=Pseudonocardia lacus TaxID=2835865 RepID=UPI001BDBFB47|nr:hypothetical protein [Pseudonocardia lacus]
MNAVRSELRKTFTTKMWWALLIPIALVSMGINAFGGLFESFVGSAADVPFALPSLLPISLSLTFTQLVVFAAVIGLVAAAGEFRHRTITTTYLVNTNRGAVLTAKLLMGGILGALYGLTLAVTGSMVGLVAQEAKPEFGELLAPVLVGTAVFALWGVIGAGVGMAIGNQVGALLVVLIYLLVVEGIATLALRNAGSETVSTIPSYLPGNAGDVAVVSEPARSLVALVPDEAGADPDELVGLLGGVTNPASTVGSLLVLAAWAAVVVGLAAFFSARRDIT